jgi:RsiW-degrading membrane proteinase PrsW (M82 family)
MTRMFPTRRVIILLIVLQVVTTIFLWTLDALNQVSNGTFALFLAVDMISFAMISYIYRHQKEEQMPSRGWLVVGSALILALLFSGLVLT